MATWFNVLHANCNVGTDHKVYLGEGSLPEVRPYLVSLYRGASMAKWFNVLHANCNAGMRHKVYQGEG